MNLNRRKYNVIIFGLIFLISLVAVFSVVEITSTTEQTNKTPEIIADDGKTETEEKENNVPLVSEQGYLPKAPAFSKAWPALSYAYGIMEKYSYKSLLTQSASNDPVLGIVVTQKVNTTKYKSGNDCLIITKASCNNKEGANYDLYVHMDKNKNLVEAKSILNGTTTNVANTISEYQNIHGATPDGYSVVFNSANCVNATFVRLGSSYKISLTINPNVAGIFNNLAKELENAPVQVKNARVHSVVAEIYINVKTGAFEQIKMIENYTVTKKTNDFGWQDATITATSTETFTFGEVDISSLIAKNFN